MSLDSPQFPLSFPFHFSSFPFPFPSAYQYRIRPYPQPQEELPNGLRTRSRPQHIPVPVERVPVRRSTTDDSRSDTNPPSSKVVRYAYSGDLVHQRKRGPS